MNTQQLIDLSTARKHAANVGCECHIEADANGMTITMDTGEVEPAAGLPAAIRIIDAYAALA